MLDLTVVIPVFNTKPWHLFEAIYSIINQSYEHKIPILIVDDCSESVDTLRTLRYFEEEKWPWAEITIAHTEKNVGTSGALNLAHEIVKTEYIAIMGSDDISHPKRLDLQARHLLKHPEIDVLGTQLSGFMDDDIFRTKKFTTNHPYIPVNKNWLTNHGTVIYKNQAVKDCGGYDESLRRAQDVDLWKRMQAKGKIIRNLQDNLYSWRRYEKK